MYFIYFAKIGKNIQKSLDFSLLVCYNVGVAWRDGRVGLRRTTGNRVYPNRYQGFESLSLRHRKRALHTECFFLSYGEEKSGFDLCTERCKGSHTPPEDLQACLQGAGRGYLRLANTPFPPIRVPLLLPRKRILTILRALHGIGFAYQARRSASLLARRRARVSSLCEYPF